jgi:uncharacterized membrane protein YkoI
MDALGRSGSGQVLRVTVHHLNKADVFMRTIAPGVAVALVAATIACSGGGETRVANGVSIGEEKKGLWAQATLSPDSAIAVALRQIPGATITKAELEEENGALIFSFDLQTAGKSGIDELHVDAKTGAILKTEHEGD